MEALTARINEAEERISDIEDQMTQNKEAEQKRDKQLLDHEGRIREISDTIRRNNIRIIGNSRRRGNREGSRRYIGENYWREFPQYGKRNKHQNPGGAENPPQNQ